MVKMELEAKDMSLTMFALKLVGMKTKQIKLHPFVNQISVNLKLFHLEIHSMTQIYLF
jgi:hypothetical protein